MTSSQSSHSGVASGPHSASQTINAGAGTGQLVFCCSERNDLWRVLADRRDPAIRARVDTLADAMAAARRGDGLLVLADGYPTAPTTLPDDFVERVVERGLRAYVEFPARLSGLNVAPPRAIDKERIVVTSDVFGRDLAPMHIAMLHDCHYVPVSGEGVEPELVVAHVAGFETAVYGLPKDAQPILLQLPGRPVMVATSKLSHFITARYAPIGAWQSIWRRILGWLSPGRAIGDLNWTPTVRPSFARDDPMPADETVRAVARGADWFFRARMLLTPDWREDGDEVGDGRHGVAECFQSRILTDGSQPYGKTLRNDCIGECAMALAVASTLTGEASHAMAGANLADFVFDGRVQTGTYDDPASPSYALMRWSEGSMQVYFADDNGRSVMGVLAAAAALGQSRWDRRLVATILANFRVSGPDALQGHNLWEPLIHKYGWQHYWRTDQASLSPHFEAWILACYLWLYDKTGHAPLLERTRRGIRRLMRAYPHQWHWTNGIQQERARMLLPLAWLVRVEDTPEHRQWLDRMAQDMLASQDACGAIREELGDPRQGLYGAPRSNERYGKSEAPLIQTNGDPVADMLYTSNFALLSLTEAAAATGDAKLHRAADRLADFLLRIQTRSEARPELDGTWFRAFDFARWEHWASNADAGWGAWCTETGWTHGWIMTMLTLRQRGIDFWSFTDRGTMIEHLDALKTMLPPDVAAERSPLTPTRPATHWRSRTIFHDDVWTCYVGHDVETTLDLGVTTPIARLAIDFCLNPQVGLVLPGRIEFLVSDDGQTFRQVALLNPPPAAARNSSTFQRVTTPPLDAAARYLRVRVWRPHSTQAVWSNAQPLQAPVGGRQEWFFFDSVLLSTTDSEAPAPTIHIKPQVPIRA